MKRKIGFLWLSKLIWLICKGRLKHRDAKIEVVLHYHVEVPVLADPMIYGSCFFSSCTWRSTLLEIKLC
nr:hypothetical protein CFP56_58532 [Quercus suber]